MDWMHRKFANYKGTDEHQRNLSQGNSPADVNHGGSNDFSQDKPYAPEAQSLSREGIDSTCRNKRELPVKAWKNK